MFFILLPRSAFLSRLFTEHPEEIAMRKPVPSSLRICLCLVLLYLSWGGSFLGMKFALGGFPPVFQNGIRLCFAGAVMLMLLPFTHHGRLSGIRELGHYVVLAFFIMFMNNVCQAVGQQTVPSGVTALLYGTVPLFMILGDWLILKGPRPDRGQTFALVGASLGMAILTLGGSSEMRGDAFGIFVILLGVLCFVAGSLYARRFLSSPGLSLYGGLAVNMLFGGLMSLAASGLMGERYDFSEMTFSSLTGMIFLTVFTSVIGYFCYYWLLVRTRTLVAVSFAYIDPVIAVVLGALFGGESLSTAIVFSCVLIVVSVIIGMNSEGGQRRRTR